MIDKIEIFINLLYLTKVFELNKKYVYISHLGLNTQMAIFYPFWGNGYRETVSTLSCEYSSFCFCKLFLVSHRYNILQYLKQFYIIQAIKNNLSKNAKIRINTEV